MEFDGGPEVIWTPDQQIMSLALYRTELRAQTATLLILLFQYRFKHFPPFKEQPNDQAKKHEEQQ